MPDLHITLLGPLHVTLHGESAAFRTDAERALLAYLAAHQPIPQRRESLAALLSPDRPDSEALTYLRNRLTRLRDALGDDQARPPWLIIDRKEIGLRRGDDIAIDLARFQQLLGEVESHAHRQLAGCPTCTARLQEAVALVRGEFLAGLTFPSEMWEAWLLGQREHIRQRALEAMAWLGEAYRERGEWEALLELARRQLALEPWLEAAHRDAMLAHYRLGDRNGALAQYAQCQQLLWDELGVAPEEETEELHRQILDGGLPDAAVSPAAADTLPLATDRFCGREGEQAALLERLVDPACRLVTLVGTGGVGKSRLAVEVGRQLAAAFPDGVRFVGLDGVRGGAEQIQIAIGEAAGLGQTDKQMTGEQVIALLREKRILLILDNCETALDGLDFLPGWLRRAPGIAILATSRQPLNFQAESVMLIDGLPTGTTEAGPAEALFAERARMARSDFALSAENLPAVRRICRLVDGLPLGIGLAAAWVRRRSLAQISDAIGASLDFLSSSLRDADPRHRSIRAAFESSWAMLDGAEQQVLAALSVFPASFSAQAAAAVANASQPHLDALCEKSLLLQQHAVERYSLHSLVRQFAAEKLVARTTPVDRAFVDFFYGFARQNQNEYAQLQPEWGNLSAAIAKAHGLGAWQTVLDFVDVLDEAWFRQIRFVEMRAGLALALDAARALEDERGLAGALLRLGEVELEQNDYSAAETHLNDALSYFQHMEERVGVAQVHYLLGRIKHERAQNESALTLFAESQRVFVEEKDWLGVAKSLNLMALCHMKQNPDFKTAHAHLTESVAIQQRLSPSTTYVEALRYLARINAIFDDTVAAENCLIEAAKISHGLNDVGEYAAVLFDRIVFYRRRKQLDVALQYGMECLALYQELGSLRWEALVKTQLAIVYLSRQNHEEALPLFGDGLQIFCELGDQYEQAYSHYYLFKLYAEIGETEQSLRSRQAALHLNIRLNDPKLRDELS